eukprot:evm.model.scf_252EXC.5 EVM.evm.TU.scf_252EXC.5   scf_252EXC:98868-107230(+)
MIDVFHGDGGSLPLDGPPEAVACVMKRDDGEMVLGAHNEPCQRLVQGHAYTFGKHVTPLFIDEVAGRVADLERSEHGKIVQQLGLVEMFRDACESVLSRLGAAPEEPYPHQVHPQYQLVFDHTCQALGCTEPNCFLCEANPRRRCSGVFDRKYFKGDILKGKCGAPIVVELRDMEGKRVAYDGGMMGVIVEMCILDGNKYDQLYPEGPAHCDVDGLNDCCLLMGNEGRPLLASYDRTANRTDGKVVVQLQGGTALLPDLNVTYSSEALLSGRRPPFRLMVKISSPGALPGHLVLPAVSEGFVVASGRSRLAQKKCIPSVDDPVGRLEHMGKERVKKLRDLVSTARMMGVDLPVNMPHEVSKVGHFRGLALEADKDGQLRQKMLHILKMSEKAWDETRDHALLAVTNDTRMRAWYQEESGEGLVYTCYLGDTDLERPVALIQGGKVILKERQAPHQRELVRELQQKARKAWWDPGHPGWMFYPYDSEDFSENPQHLPPPSAPRPLRPGQGRALELGGCDLGPPRVPSSKGVADTASLGLGSMNGSLGGYLPSIPSLGTSPENLSISESLAYDDGGMARGKKRRLDDDSAKKFEWGGHEAKAQVLAAGGSRDGRSVSLRDANSGGSGPRIISPFENPGQQRVIFSMCHQPPPQPIQPEPPLESPFSDISLPKPEIVKVQAEDCRGRRNQHVPVPEEGSVPSANVAKQMEEFIQKNSTFMGRGPKSERRHPMARGGSFTFSAPRSNPVRGSADLASIGLRARTAEEGGKKARSSVGAGLGPSGRQWPQHLSLGSIETLDANAKSAIRHIELARRLEDGTVSILPMPSSNGGEEGEGGRLVVPHVDGVSNEAVMRMARVAQGGGRSERVLEGRQVFEEQGRVVGDVEGAGDGAQDMGEYVSTSNSQGQIIVLGNTSPGGQHGGVFPYGSVVLLPINMTQQISSTNNNNSAGDEAMVEADKAN